MNWLVQHSRLDLAVGVSVGSKKLQKARTTDMRKVIKLVEQPQENVVEVEMGWFGERGGVSLEVFLDASLGNVEEGSHRLGCDRVGGWSGR